MSLLIDNLLSPVVLCFVLGIGARLVRSDLTIPEPIYQGISIYLLLAIGLKGGAALAVTPLSEFFLPAMATLALGGITPVIAYAAMRKVGGLGQIDAAAVAAHYGSVSVVTYLAATEAVSRIGLTSEAYLPALVALLEVPGIVIALLFAGAAGSRAPRTQTGAIPPVGGGWRRALHEVLAGKSIVLLVGGLIIGTLCGPERLTDVQPFFGVAFKGMLCLFMIELGLAAGRRLRDAGHAGLRLLSLGCVLPVVLGALGVAVGALAGMSVGGAAILGAMSASASYIAAPAAVRVALPQANPAYYLTLALGITFPFNLTVGIPLYIKLAQWIPSLS